MDGHKTSHLPIRYFLALLWAHPILHISTIRVNDQLFTRDKYDLFTSDRDWLLTDVFFTSESLSPIASDRSQLFTSNGYYVNLRSLL